MPTLDAHPRFDSAPVPGVQGGHEILCPDEDTCRAVMAALLLALTPELSIASRRALNRRQRSLSAVTPSERRLLPTTSNLRGCLSQLESSAMRQLGETPQPNQLHKGVATIDEGAEHASDRASDRASECASECGVDDELADLMPPLGLSSSRSTPRHSCMQRGDTPTSSPRLGSPRGACDRSGSAAGTEPESPHGFERSLRISTRLQDMTDIPAAPGSHLMPDLLSPVRIRETGRKRSIFRGKTSNSLVGSVETSSHPPRPSPSSSTPALSSSAWGRSARWAGANAP